MVRLKLRESEGKGANNNFGNSSGRRRGGGGAWTLVRMRQR
jgi:hypothetical protein